MGICFLPSFYIVLTFICSKNIAPTKPEHSDTLSVCRNINQATTTMRNLYMSIKSNAIRRNSRCRICNENGIGKRRAAYGHLTCKPCAEVKAKDVRKSWCVLTLHKQGAMFFTPEFARQAAVGANNKGGIVR